MRMKTNIYPFLKNRITLKTGRSNIIKNSTPDICLYISGYIMTPRPMIFHLNIQNTTISRNCLWHEYRNSTGTHLLRKYHVYQCTINVLSLYYYFETTWPNAIIVSERAIYTNATIVSERAIYTLFSFSFKRCKQIPHFVVISFVVNTRKHSGCRWYEMPGCSCDVAVIRTCLFTNIIHW